MATPPALASSAYFGTSCMSINGDLPGLSKCWSGTIGSYQYSGLRSPDVVAFIGDITSAPALREYPHQ